MGRLLKVPFLCSEKEFSIQKEEKGVHQICYGADEPPSTGKVITQVHSRTQNSALSQDSSSHFFHRHSRKSPRPKLLLGPSNSGPTGSTTIMPKCLRPLTLEEEYAPPPPYRAHRLWLQVNHPMRKWRHRGKAVQELPWGEGPLTPGTMPEPATVGEGMTPPDSIDPG